MKAKATTEQKRYRLKVQIDYRTIRNFWVFADSEKEAIDKGSKKGVVVMAKEMRKTPSGLYTW